MKIRLGTRGSILALKQAKIARKAIEDKFKVETEIIKIKTSGDKIKNRSLIEYGGKGLFIKEIEQVLIDKKIDLAVHSLKDIPGNIKEINEKLVLAGFLEREDPRDVFVSCYHKNLASLPQGAVIGTCAPRRALQLRTDLQTSTLRGNVTTRIKKAKNFDGIILALAGIKRLNMAKHITEILPTEIMLPAVGQGIICLQSRKDDNHMINILEQITHKETKIAAVAERSFLTTIGGNCYTPLAALATIKNNTLNLKAMLEISGKPHFIEKTGKIDKALTIGKNVAEELLEIQQ
ncbi:MAG: hydroxymethylbilane synthase [Rickettsiaceae bacterium H1]|nr:hydroxymethylbilane synthase [Rickettsiaceae bacterium H1]